MPPGRRVSGTTVRPCAGVRGRRCTRGSPVSGAPTSSSSGTWWARASGSSSSSVGRRCPDSSRDSVLTEVPVSSDSCVRVSPRRWRSARSRGPTAVSTASVIASSSAMPVICRSGNVRCQVGSTAGRLPGMEHAAHHGHGEMRFDEASWEERYGAAPALWSGRANPQLVAEAAGLTPGRALDAGAGEGGDALWLAGRGWRVTAVDLSEVALERGARAAAERGLADRVEWRQADLTQQPPEPGTYDLVTAAFLHPAADVRERVVAGLAAAVAP